jgi:hypothetical protein
MGGEPWFHVAPYQSDIPAVLEALRRRVFTEGEYRGSDAEPASIEEALENMDADGTASILDIDHVADNPEPTGVSALTPAKAQEWTIISLRPVNPDGRSRAALEKPRAGPRTVDRER